MRTDEVTVVGLNLRFNCPTDRNMDWLWKIYKIQLKIRLNVELKYDLTENGNENGNERFVEFWRVKIGTKREVKVLHVC